MLRHSCGARRAHRGIQILALGILGFGLSVSALEVHIMHAMQSMTLRLPLPGPPRPAGDPNTPDEAKTGRRGTSGHATVATRPAQGPARG